LDRNGLPSLALKYCNEKKLSQYYLNLLDVDILSEIQKELGLLDLSKATPKKKSLKENVFNNR